MEYKDYYKTLGINRDATEKEIKAAYRKLARKYHPDVNPDAGDKFKEINEAHEVLSSPEKRQRYDSLGSNWRHGSNFEPPPGFEGFDFNFQNMGDMGGFGGASTFSDFFEAIFGSMGGMGGMGGRGHQQRVEFGDFSQFQNPHGQHPHHHQQQQPRKQDLDVHQTLELSLEEIFQDNLKKTVLIKDARGLTKSLSVKIPRGIKPGEKIKLKGQGGQAQGIAGDLYLKVEVRSSDGYKIEDNNLIYETSISIPDLALGTNVIVPTMQGKVTLKIPARTEPGKKLRIKGRGLPGKTEQDNGDLYVRVKARFPEAFSQEEEALYSELKKLESAHHI